MNDDTQCIIGLLVMTLLLGAMTAVISKEQDRRKDIDARLKWIEQYVSQLPIAATNATCYSSAKESK